jgi:hypothetical protein
MKTDTDYLQSSLRIFRQYKKLGEDTMQQLTDEQLFFQPDPDSNSIALLVFHLSGNMQSRWTDFLTSDGEKSWRNRDTEFESKSITRQELLDLWEKGWQCLFTALEPLDASQLSSIVYIRHEPHSVMEAVNRQIAHYSYHVGQMVYLGKLLNKGNWKSLSIPKGKSQDFNNNMMR